MIPYAVFAGTIYCTDGTKLCVQALELNSACFTFRLPEGTYLPEGSRLPGNRSLPAGTSRTEDQIARVEVSLFQFDVYDYVTIPLTNYRIRERGEGLYLLETSDAAYARAAEQLTREYRYYAELKLQEDEAGLTEALTGLSDAEPYAGSWAQQRHAWMQTVRGEACTAEAACLKVLRSFAEQGELAIWLNSRALQQAYLDQPLEAFLQDCRDRELPVHGCRVTHIYLGDSTCPLRYPKVEILERLLEKMAAEKVQPVFVLAPMAERYVELYRARIDWLLTCTARYGWEPEVVINDIGVLELLHGKPVRITAGSLLARRKKDARLDHKPGKEQVIRGNPFASVDEPLYRRWLLAASVDKVTYECSGYPFAVEAGAVLELPFYRMNVASHCTLYAACHNGARSRQEAAADCPGYCESAAFLYPDNRQMVGIGNALYGFDRRSLEDAAYLQSFLEQGIGRIVVNSL